MSIRSDLEKVPLAYSVVHLLSSAGTSITTPIKIYTLSQQSTRLTDLHVTPPPNKT